MTRAADPARLPPVLQAIHKFVAGLPAGVTAEEVIGAVPTLGESLSPVRTANALLGKLAAKGLIYRDGPLWHTRAAGSRSRP